MLASAASASTILGTGTASCGTWTADKQENGPAWVGDLEWLSGYLSAYSAYKLPSERDVAHGLDEGAREAWVSNYCLAHPLDEIYVAADALIAELKHRAR